MPASSHGNLRATSPGSFDIGMLGTYPPRICGLATFAAALEREFVDAGRRVRIISINDGKSESAGPAAHAELCNGVAASVQSTARTLSRCDVTIVQHEFGIYGGADGDEVVEILRRSTAPAIVVAHTVPLTPTDHQRSVLEEVCDLADRVVVMSDAARTRLVGSYRVDGTRVRLIPHGAWSPNHPATTPRAGSPARPHLLTWGLLGPGKGIEHMVGAMSMLGDLVPRVRYTVAGVTHPNVFAREADSYRQSLIRQAWNSGVAAAVRFDDSYRDVPTLQRFVATASLVVLPYDSVDQVTSGVLVDALAAGRPVIATAFPHAVELLADGAGIVVPHGDPTALATAVRSALTNPAVFHSMTARARALAPSLAWSSVAAQYLALCDELQPAVTAAGVAG